MSSIKQLIINAIIKISEENPALNNESDLSAVQVRDAFIQSLMQELFPEETTVVTVARTEPAAVPAKSPKKPAVPKEDKAAAAAAKAAEKEAAKVAKEAEKAAKAAEKEAAKAAKAQSPKKTKAVKVTKAPEPVPEPVPEPAPAPAPESPKKAAKAPKKAKAPEDANLPKIDPTWRKHLKKADKDGAKESEPLLLAYLNAMTKEEFNATKAEDHVAAFVAGRAAPAPVKEDGMELAGLEIVEFEGKEYFVNPETKRVFEGEGVHNAETGGWSSYKPVGYQGMAKFAEMEL